MDKKRNLYINNVEKKLQIIRIWLKPEKSCYSIPRAKARGNSKINTA
jgi:hypothetical protein